jgi:hypothetical protein
MNSFTNKFPVGVPVFETDGCYCTKNNFTSNISHSFLGMYTNFYIFGSSRGRSMSQVKCKQVNILPVGTYSKLCDLAEKQLRNNTDLK